MLNFKFKILLFVTISCLAQGLLSVIHAYDFSPSRTKMISNIGANQQRLAIVFENKGANQLEGKTNLVQLKSQFSREMSQTFQVADPVVVGEVMKKNNLTVNDLLESQYLLGEFKNRVDAQVLLVVSLSSDIPGKLSAGHTVIDGSNQARPIFTIDYPLESLGGSTSQAGFLGSTNANTSGGGLNSGNGFNASAGLNSGNGLNAGGGLGSGNSLGTANSSFNCFKGQGNNFQNQGGNSLNGSLQQSNFGNGQNSLAGNNSNTGFYSQSNSYASNQGYNNDISLMAYLPLGNYNHLNYDSWFFFNPTGIANPQVHYLETGLWTKDWEGVDLPVEYARYSLTFRRFEIALYGYASQIKEYRGKSGYGHIKVNLIDASSFNFPVFFSLGVKKNLFWDEDNLDLKYNDDTEILEENEGLNDVSLFEALTIGFGDIGLLLNLYYDNVYVGAGAKFLMHSIVRLFIDYQALHIKTDHKKNDFAYGIEINDPASQGFSFSLAYQLQTEKTMLTFTLTSF